MSTQKELQLEYKLARDFTLENVPGSIGYLLIKIVPNPSTQLKSLPVNISVVIDVSRSMAGKKIKCAIGAVKSLVESLKENDSISIITFSDNAKIILPTKSIGDKPGILGIIDKIHIENGTRMFLGLDQSIKEIEKNRSNNTINRLILLTDGQSENEKRCRDIITTSKNNQVIAIGIGEKYNEDLLIFIADQTSGCFYHLDVPDQIIGILQNEFQNASDALPVQSSLNIRLIKGVKLESIDRIFPNSQKLQPSLAEKDNNFTIDPGEIKKSEPTILGVRFSLPSQSQCIKKIAHLTFKYNFPSLGIEDKSEEAEIFVNYTSNEDLCARVDREVVSYFNQLDTQIFVGQAISKTRIGDIAGASSSLLHAQEITRRLGNITLANSIESAISELKQDGKLSEASIKTIKAGSRHTRRINKKNKF